MRLASFDLATTVHLVLISSRSDTVDVLKSCQLIDCLLGWTQEIDKGSFSGNLSLSSVAVLVRFNQLYAWTLTYQLSRVIYFRLQIAVDGSSNSTTKKVDVPFSSEKATPESPSTPAPSLETAASVFMADVANLIKWVSYSYPRVGADYDVIVWIGL